MKKKILLVIILSSIIINFIIPFKIMAKSVDIDSIVLSMSKKEKIAQMIMPAFRKYNGSDVETINTDIENLFSNYNFAGVILYGENAKTAEGTIKLIDSMQRANKDNLSRLLISIDQEGGYVNRLGQSTGMPGNMALAATGNVSNSYESAKIIGQELSALGIDIDFAPVVDINSNPENPIIGVRAFSDDPNIVATYGEQFMKGLQSQGVITSLKHFPGHGDTSEDTHKKMIISDKNYNQLKQNELIPFQRLINSGTEMVMISHIQYPNIDSTKYTSKFDNQEYTLPASLSKKIITDILRSDMGFKGIVVSDSMDMGAISNNFEILDASVLAINAGVDILLTPFVPQNSADFTAFKKYIDDLASKVGNEISEEKVNESVKKILTLKKEKGLLEKYDSSKLDSKIANAKNVVSSKSNHDKEFEMAKDSMTLLKNDNNLLPLNENDKTLILYAYESHFKAIENALDLLIRNNKISSKENISIMDFTDDMNKIKDEISNVDNVVIINAMYNYTSGASSFTGFVAKMIDEIINYANSNMVSTVFLSTHLPYDTARFSNADAIIATYLSNGIRFNLSDYEELIPVYGPSVMSGIYKIFEKKGSINGKLPVNVYSVDSEKNLTSNVLYKRGYGLNYLQLANTKSIQENIDKANSLINSDSSYIEETLNSLKEIYDNCVNYLKNDIYEDKQDEVDELNNKLVDAINNLKVKYKIIDGANQRIHANSRNRLVVVVNGNVKDFIKLLFDNSEVDKRYYLIEIGSTIVTLKPEYLETIDSGNHTITFVYTNGEVSTNVLLFNDVRTSNPDTSDNIVIYFITLFISLLSVILLFKLRNI